MEALNAIKRRLIDPNRNLSNWNQGDPCIENWRGVFCYNKTLDDGYLHVRGLYGFNYSLLPITMLRLMNYCLLLFLYSLLLLWEVSYSYICTLFVVRIRCWEDFRGSKYLRLLTTVFFNCIGFVEWICIWVDKLT